MENLIRRARRGRASDDVGTEAGAASSDEVEVPAPSFIGEAGVRSVEKPGIANEICAQLAGSFAD
jgi:hypothetical protein